MLLVSLTAGCDLAGDDDLEPIEGSWEASTFTVLVNGELHDILEAGGELNMTLLDDGTVESGLLSVPCTVPQACEPDEGDVFEVTFEGTYDRDGQSVTFSHEADTFIRGEIWTYDGNSLTTETNAGVTVVLTR